MVELIPIDLKNENRIVDGVDVYEALCPVSSVTGCRENPLQLLKSLVNDPQKGRLLDSILQELPSNNSPAGLSNDDLLEQLMPALEGTTFYEQDKFAERLMAISGDLLKTQGIQKPITEVKESPSVESPSVQS